MGEQFADEPYKFRSRVTVHRKGPSGPWKCARDWRRSFGSSDTVS